MSMKAAKEAMGSVEKVDGAGAISDQGGFQAECLKHLYLQAGQNWLIAQDISLHSSEFLSPGLRKKDHSLLTSFFWPS